MLKVARGKALLIERSQTVKTKPNRESRPKRTGPALTIWPQRPEREREARSHSKATGALLELLPCPLPLLTLLLVFNPGLTLEIVVGHFNDLRSQEDQRQEVR